MGLTRPLLPAVISLLVLAPAAAADSPRARTSTVQQAEQALEVAEDLRDGRGVRTGRELTDALRELRLRLRHLRGEERARAKAHLARPTDDPPDDGSPEPHPDFFEPGLDVQRRCGAHFCVHYVVAGRDAAAPTYADLVLLEAEQVRAFENGVLDWRNPPSDDGIGGDDRTDIYLQDLARRKLFGYAEAEGDGRDQEAPAFLVLDRAFDPNAYGGAPALKSLRLTLAHEYGHVLQYGYDITADGWHYESSAVWLEHRLDPTLDDWLTFVFDGSTRPGWRSLTELPLTSFGHPSDPRDAKAYGGAVWNHFLSGVYGSAGDRLQRAAWESSTGYRAPSTRSYDLAIKAAGGDGMAEDFTRFAAAVAEWQVPELGFALPERLPADVERRGSLIADGGGAALAMDHLTFALYDVPDTSAERIRLVANFPSGVHGALALVARRGAAGSVTTRISRLPSGGTGAVVLDNPHSFIEGGGRITAVLVNADSSQGGYGDTDWVWTRDDQDVAAALTTDFNGPTIASRTPGPDARGVRTDEQIRVTFSNAVSGVGPRSFVLRDSRGRTVPAGVTYTSASRTATLAPSAPLSDTSRYRVVLSGAITDAAANALEPAEWTFTTVTQRPRIGVREVFSGAGTLGFQLSSSDADRLRFAARLVSDGRTLARKSGVVKAGTRRPVRLRTARRGRARLIVEVVDPQGNRRVLERKLRLRR